jgi:hypothetical protein
MTFIYVVYIYVYIMSKQWGKNLVRMESITNVMNRGESIY